MGEKSAGMKYCFNNSEVVPVHIKSKGRRKEKKKDRNGIIGSFQDSVSETPGVMYSRCSATHRLLRVGVQSFNNSGARLMSLLRGALRSLSLMD